MSNIELAQLLIRVGTGITMLSFGLHQLFQPKEWTDYIPEWLSKLIPLSKETDIRIHSLGNIGLGILLIIGFYLKTVTIVNIIWWLSIVPFAFMKEWRIGLRDLSIVFGLVALFFLL